MIEVTTCADESVKVHLTSVTPDLAYVTLSVTHPCRDAHVAATRLYGCVAALLRERQMVPVHERLFGSLEVSAAVLQARGKILDRSGVDPGTPVTYLEGRPLWGQGLAGVHLHALKPSSSRSVWTIGDGEIPCGRGWMRHGSTFLVLQNLHGLPSAEGSGAGAPEQAQRMFERAERLLQGQGADYRQVARTWIYLSQILDWYDEFNGVRNAMYRRFGLMPAPGDGAAAGRILLPASTGIRADSPLGAACVMDLLAVVGPPGGPAPVEQMTNIRQQDAFRYGSAFSRGACIRQPDVVQIEVSGTAAIDERGVSLFPGDVRAQMVRTLDNVEALIAQKGASLQDICEATVFLKRAEDAGLYREVMAERGLSDFPAITVLADVCREELLFEIDAVAQLAPDG